MKRFAFWFVLTLLVISWLRSGRHEGGPGPEWVRTAWLDSGEGDRDRRVVLEARDDEGPGHGRVWVDGLPVPVIPGTRVTEARDEPPKSARDHKRRHRVEPAKAQATPAAPLWAVTGRLSATEGRARRDAHAQLRTLLAARLAPDVPESWVVPTRLVDRLVRKVEVKEVDRGYGRLYEATLLVDFSPGRRAEVVASYHRQQVVGRLATLGGLLAFVLVCLGSLAGYIRADEATKGYYTTPLRLAAAAGVGASGVLLYQALA